MIKTDKNSSIHDKKNLNLLWPIVLFQSQHQVIVWISAMSRSGITGSHVKWNQDDNYGNGIFSDYEICLKLDEIIYIIHEDLLQFLQ